MILAGALVSHKHLSYASGFLVVVARQRLDERLLALVQRRVGQEILHYVCDLRIPDFGRILTVDFGRERLLVSPGRIIRRSHRRERHRYRRQERQQQKNSHY